MLKEVTKQSSRPLLTLPLRVGLGGGVGGGSGIAVMSYNTSIFSQSDVFLSNLLLFSVVNSVK